MSEDLTQLKRDYEAISTSGNTPGVRDLYPYIVSQKGLTEKDIPEQNICLVIGCHWIVLAWFTPIGVLVSHGFVWLFVSR